MNQEELKQLLTYDPETGIFNWKIKRNGIKYNKSAGCLCKDGYIRIRIKPKLYEAHRLAFLYMTGSIPEQVDHIDMNRSNNKWKNLRPVNNAKNSANKLKYKNNKSGFKGVYFIKNRKKCWESSIMVNGVKFFIGYFNTPEEAAIAYDKKAIELLGEYCNINFK